MLRLAQLLSAIGAVFSAIILYSGICLSDCDFRLNPAAFIAFSMLFLFVSLDKRADRLQGAVGVVVVGGLVVALIVRGHFCLPCAAMEVLLLAVSICALSSRSEAREIKSNRIILGMVIRMAFLIVILVVVPTAIRTARATNIGEAARTNIDACAEDGHPVSLRRPILIFSYDCDYCGDVLEVVAKLPAGQRPLFLSWGNYTADLVAKTRDGLARHGLAGSAVYFGYVKTDGLPLLIEADGNQIAGSQQIINLLKRDQDST